MPAVAGTIERRASLADLEKYLEAALAGWRVVRLAEPLITAPMVERLIAFVRGGGVKSV